MNKCLVLSLVLLVFASSQSLFSQEKGYLTITQSETATPPVYDGAVEKLKAAGVWELGWTFHAIGAAQPAGLFSIGVFPDIISLETRVAKTDEVFNANSISVPAAQVFEIHNIFSAPFPAVKPASAVLIYHEVVGMTPEKYEQVLVELKTSGAFPSPAQLFHVCFKTEKGLQVVDIWDSPESLQKFAGVIVPILTKIFGAEPPQPKVFGLYNVVQH